MKVMFLYPNSDGYFRCPIGMTLVMTVLAEEGHKVKLFDTTFMAVAENNDNKFREKNGTAKPVPTAHLYNKHSEEELISVWIKAIEDFKPDLIAASILEDMYEFCSTLLDAAKKHFNIPICAGGITPTLSPNVVIEHPSIDMLVQGEGEVAFKELVNALKNKTSLSEVPNLWYKEKDGKIKINRLVRYMDMNKLPNQRYDFWENKHFFKSYKGAMVKSGYFEMSRGCMHKCHYCFNRYVQIGLAQKETGKYRRNKSADTIIREVKELQKTYNFEFIFFGDDNFLGRSFSEMDEFYERWSKEINIPYWINTCIETLNEDNIPKLKKSKCDGIGIGMETGSEWIRRNVLLKGKMTNEMYLEGFRLMAEHGIRSTCNNMIGFPGEFEEDFFESIKLSKKIRALDPEMTSCNLNYVAPYAGTVIHNICLELGLMDVSNKPGFRGLCKKVNMLKEPTIINPCMSREKTIEIHDNFSDYVEGKKDIPKKFLETDPLRKFAEGNEVANQIYKLYERYKNGPADIVPDDLNLKGNQKTKPISLEISGSI